MSIVGWLGIFSLSSLFRSPGRGKLLCLSFLDSYGQGKRLSESYSDSWSFVTPIDISFTKARHSPVSNIKGYWEVESDSISRMEWSENILWTTLMMIKDFRLKKLKCPIHCKIFISGKLLELLWRGGKTIIMRDFSHSFQIDQVEKTK